MAGSDNNTRNSRVKTIGIFVGVALVLTGLTAGALYFAGQRSRQLADANQNQVAQQDETRGQTEQEQATPDSQAPDQNGQEQNNRGEQQNGENGAGTAAPDDQQGAGQGGTPAPQQQPAPQQTPPQQRPETTPATGPTVQTVPSTGPEETAFFLRVGMLAVMVYAASRWLSSRNVRA